MQTPFVSENFTRQGFDNSSNALLEIERLKEENQRNISELNRIVSTLTLAQGNAWRENRFNAAQLSARLSRENAQASEMANRLETTIKNYIATNYRCANEDGCDQ